MEITFENVRDIIVNTLSCDADQITPETNLFEDLEADSLEAVELSMALEEAFGVGISDEDLEGITNEMMSAFGGAEGMAKMQSLMDGLRADAPKAIAGLAVESVVDYEQDGTGLPKANVLEYRLAGGEKFIVRPSGTEPKIKTYLSALAPTAAEAAQEEAKLKAAAEEMMK